MKKFYLLFLLMLSPLMASAASVEIDGIYYKLSDDTKQAKVTHGSSNYNSYTGSVIIPEKVKYEGVEYSVTSIGSEAFYYCSDLTSVTIPNSITKIGVDAFHGCSSLTSVTIPNSVTNLETGAFWNCSGLTSVTIGDGVTGIGMYAFSGCSGLTSITIPNSVTSIGSEAFSDCHGLTSITIPASVTSIENNVFRGCRGLTSIKVEAGNTAYDSREECNAIIETESNRLITGCKNTIIPAGVSSIGSYAFYYCDALTSITIPNSVTSIGSGAFSYCGLTSVTIPHSVTSIESGAFSNCWLLTAFMVESGNASYSSENGVLFNKDKTTLIQYPEAKTGMFYVFPASVTSIESSAFSSCDNLISVTIPNSVTSIGYKAFSDCRGLNSITIGNNVTSIENYAFVGCQQLTDVYCLAENVPDIKPDVFDSSNIENVTLHVPEGSVEAYRAAESWSGFGQIVAAVESESIEISSAKQLAYCSDKALDFSNLNGLKAYVATGYDKATGTIWLTRVKQVPAEMGFLLIGDEGRHDIPVVQGISDCYYKNMFKGTISGETIQTTDGNYTNYYLSKGEQGVGFYKVTKEGGVEIKPNRAYLPILTDIPANGSGGDTELIKVSAALQVPYYTSKNLDFTTMESQGVKAYTATGYNYGTGTIWLSRVKKVPARTGVLVIATSSGDYDIPTASVASTFENMFVGSETAQTIYYKQYIDGVDYMNYYLSNGDYGVGFYKVTMEGVSMGANRCYLQIPYRAMGSYARGESADTAPAWSDIILSDEDDDIIAIPVYGSTNGDDDGTTNVQSSIFNVQSPDVYYNLQGQRVDNPDKGIYIKKGKVVVIK